MVAKEFSVSTAVNFPNLQLSLITAELVFYWNKANTYFLFKSAKLKLSSD